MPRPGRRDPIMRLAEEWLHQDIEGLGRRIEDRDPELPGVDRVGEEAIEGGVVGRARIADEAPERVAAHPDVQAEGLRPGGQDGRGALVVLVRRDDRGEVRPVLLGVQGEERGAHCLDDVHALKRPDDVPTDDLGIWGSLLGIGHEPRLRDACQVPADH
jgi:hypothetical protein